MLIYYVTMILIFLAVQTFSDNVFSSHLANIGNDIDSNFDFVQNQNLNQDYKLKNKLKKKKLSIKFLVKDRISHKPTLDQIIYLLKNKNNPFPQAYTRARVLLKGETGVTGLIHLKQIRDGPVLIYGTIKNLPRDGKFGFHFHELPVLGSDCNSAGQHFNPYGVNHGSKEDGELGDLGNVINQGFSCHVVKTKHSISLKGKNSVLGRSLVVHLYEDDLGRGLNRESKKNGNSGPRLACGTVFLLPPILNAENKLN